MPNILHHYVKINDTLKIKRTTKRPWLVTSAQQGLKPSQLKDLKTLSKIHSSILHIINSCQEKSQTSINDRKKKEKSLQQETNNERGGPNEEHGRYEVEDYPSAWQLWHFLPKHHPLGRNTLWTRRPPFHSGDPKRCKCRSITVLHRQLFSRMVPLFSSTV